MNHHALFLSVLCLILFAGPSLAQEEGLLENLQEGLSLSGEAADAAPYGDVDGLLAGSHSKYDGDSDGFQLLNVHAPKNRGILAPTLITKYINLTIGRNPDLKHVPVPIRTAVGHAMAKLLQYSADVDKSSYNFNILYSTEDGQVIFSDYTFKLRPDGQYTVERIALSGTFELEKEYMIVSSTKATYHGEETTQELVYIARDLSEANIDDILNLVYMPSRLLAEFENGNLGI
eukprot:TRINITY_DN248_c0_g1_i1.p1 TRINITY_DN248_c0_g1~~TRINITY_DN248_c0_g1_i1.p1  ORF type:complete len:232 (+),score=70.54 TRINITY_DN248_c0_g1_i1:3-698(+)